MTPLLALHKINAGYAEIPVLHDVSLSLYPGKIYALLGPNGGGKWMKLPIGFFISLRFKKTKMSKL